MGYTIMAFIKIRASTWTSAGIINADIVNTPKYTKEVSGLPTKTEVNKYKKTNNRANSRIVIFVDNILILFPDIEINTIIRIKQAYSMVIIPASALKIEDSITLTHWMSAYNATISEAQTVLEDICFIEESFY